MLDKSYRDLSPSSYYCSPFLDHGSCSVPNPHRPPSRDTSILNHFKLKQSAPYLALLGDIGHAGDDRFFAFLEKQVKRYWAVFFLIGNHEPYHLTLPAAKARLRAFAERWNVCVLSQLLGNSFSFP